MSALMSASPPKADIAEHRRDVRLVPKADIRPGSRLSQSRGRGANRRMSPKVNWNYRAPSAVSGRLATACSDSPQIIHVAKATVHLR
jgi:hypothetical protein